MTASKKFSKNLKFYHIAAIVAVLLSTLFSISAFGLWREKLIDLLFTQHQFDSSQTGAGLTDKKPLSQVVIVAIDEESINEIGQWPWPRAVFALAIQKLQSAKAIGIDVNFKEPSSRGAGDDAAFANALKISKVPVVLSAELQEDGSTKYPLKEFWAYSQSGFTNIKVSADGVVREYKRLEATSEMSFPKKEDAKNPWVAAAKSFASQIHDQAGVSPTNQPIPNNGRINYYGGRGSFSTLSFRDVIVGKIPENFLRDKIVLIGATAADLQDFHQTPVGIMSGVEIQANILQTFLDRKFYKSLDTLNLTLIIFLAFVAAWFSFRVKKLPRLILGGIIMFVAYNLAAMLSFNRFLILDLLYPDLSIILSFGLSVSSQYVTVQKEKKFIRESFGYYLAPEIIEEIIKNPEKLKLGGEQRIITVLFSDIRGFTTISEKMIPQELTHFINRYLTVMSEIVLSHGGIIDKYIGDAIMAFWGAPFDNPSQSLDAVLAARDMMSALKKFNEENKAGGHPEINIGIGIHSGPAVVGNMGSEKRFDYTALGDTVNLASRLEGLNKEYGTNIIVSQAVVDSIKKADAESRQLSFEKLGEAKVKGKNEAVMIYKIF